MHRRCDAFLKSNLTTNVMCIGADGPLGRFDCGLRSFVLLTLLHERCLRDLFAAKFAGAAVRGSMEPMGTEDPLDYVDFVEAMVGGWAAGNFRPTVGIPA